MQPFSLFLTEQYPQYKFLLPMIEAIIGKHPDWQDLTKSNLHKIKKGMLEELSANTVKTYLSILKSTLNRASDEVKIPCKDYEAVLNVRKEASTAAYLSEEELERLIRVKPKSDAERYVQSIFAIQAYTGCRISDAMDIVSSNIQDQRITYVSIKSKREATIPLKPMVVAMVERLKTLKPVGMSAFDRIIKRLCFAANIRQEVKIFRGGKTIVKPKYLLVSSHTARRSFATNLYLRGLDLYTISQYMGHANIAMTENYICSGIRDIDEKIKSYFE